MVLVKLSMANDDGEPVGTILVNTDQIIAVTAGQHATEMQMADGRTRWVKEPLVGTETADIVSAIRPAHVDGADLVFATREGMPLDRWNLLRKHVKPAAKGLGISRVTWHLLRHSHATMLDGVGTPIGTMQSLLGHSSPEITREIYLHAIPEEQRRAVESVERLVLGPKLDPTSLSTELVSARVN
jgi:integrase